MISFTSSIPIIIIRSGIFFTRFKINIYCKRSNIYFKRSRNL
nr:MAG TPA: hypothetical protein [Crassvirales sp.]